jgi:ABC-2 type transport system ATP-binding protein
MIREQVDSGVTVLLTTQYLEEADVLADRIAVLAKGRVIADGTPGELKRKVGGDRLEVSVASAADLPAVEKVLASVSLQAPTTDLEARRVSVPLSGGVRVIAAAAADLEAAGVEPEDFAVRRSSLDDVFLALTGHTPADETAAQPADKQKQEATA